METKQDFRVEVEDLVKTTEQGAFVEGFLLGALFGKKEFRKYVDNFRKGYEEQGIEGQFDAKMKFLREYFAEEKGIFERCLAGE